MGEGFQSIARKRGQETLKVKREPHHGTYLSLSIHYLVTYTLTILFLDYLSQLYKTTALEYITQLS